jgi:hypothetical protein
MALHIRSVAATPLSTTRSDDHFAECDRPTGAPSPALWEDFVDIFFAPREVFRRRSEGRPLPVLLVLTGLMVGLAFVYQVALGPAIEADLMRALETRAGSDAQMTPAQLEGMRAVSSVLAPLAMLVTVPLGVLVTGLFAWVLARAFGRAVRFAVTVVAYAQLPESSRWAWQSRRVPSSIAARFSTWRSDLSASWTRPIPRPFW